MFVHPGSRVKPVPYWDDTGLSFLALSPALCSGLWRLAFVFAALSGGLPCLALSEHPVLASPAQSLVSSSGEVSLDPYR